MPWGGAKLLDEATELRGRAKRMRVLSFQVTDREASQRLKAHADELDARAEAIEKGPFSRRSSLTPPAPPDAK